MAVVYNNGNTIGPIPHEEIPIKWSPEHLMKVERAPTGLDTISDLFGNISQVPVAMMACKYKEEFDELKPG